MNKSTASWTIQNVWNDLLTEDYPIKPRNYIRASEIGKSHLERYLAMKGVKPTNPFSARIKRIFDVGLVFEVEVVERIFRLLGILVDSQQQVKTTHPDMLDVVGHYDHKVGGVINKESAEKAINDPLTSGWMKKRASRLLKQLLEIYPNGLQTLIAEVKTVNCVARGQLISTMDGLKKIEDIKIGDEVFSMQNDFSLIKNKVKNVYNTGIKPVFKMTTKTGKVIIATSKHKFLSTNVSYLADRNIKKNNIMWKEMNEIKVGNKIAVVNKYPDIIVKNWKNNSKNRKKDIFFDIIKTIEPFAEVETFDIEVEGDNENEHSFCCQDILVHNSMAFWAHKNMDPITGFFKGYDHHKLQLFTYLMATEEAEGRLFYISKDDMTLFETPVHANDVALKQLWLDDISKMTHYYKKDIEPAKPDDLVFNEQKQVWEFNWQVSRSPYFTLTTGKKTVEEWEDSLRDELKAKNTAQCKLCKKDFQLVTLNKNNGMCARCAKKAVNPK